MPDCDNDKFKMFVDVIPRIMCPHCAMFNNPGDILKNSGRCKRCNRFVDPIKDAGDKISIIQTEITTLMQMPEDNRERVEYIPIMKKKLGEKRMELRLLRKLQKTKN